MNNMSSTILLALVPFLALGACATDEMMFGNEDKQDMYISNMTLDDNGDFKDEVAVACQGSFATPGNCELKMDITVSNDSLEALKAVVERAGRLEVATYALMSDEGEDGWKPIADGTLDLVMREDSVLQRIDLEPQHLKLGWTKLVITKKPIDALPELRFMVFVDLQ